MTDEQTDTAVREFPFGSAASSAVDLVWTRVPVLVRAAGGWVAVQFVVFLASFWGVATWIGFDAEFAATFSAFSPPAQDGIIMLVPMLFSVLAVAAIAVNWHRFALLGEHPRGLLPFHAAQTALYGWRLVLTFGIVVVVGGLVSFLVLMVLSPLARHPTLSNLFVVIPLALSGFALVLMLRTGLALPGAAIGDRKWTLEYSWHRTDGNSWRLFGGFLMILVPLYLVNTMVAWLMGNAAEQGSVVLLHVGVALSYVINAFGAAVAAGYYSQAFTFFADAKDRPPASHFS